MKLKHDLRLGKNFHRFKYCDASLTTDGSRFLPVHRSILASVSPKLEALFDSNYRSKIPLVVEHVDFDSLETVIESIYAGEIALDDNRTDDLVTKAMQKLQIGLIVPERIISVAVQTEIEEVKCENNERTVVDVVESETGTIKDVIDNNTITAFMAAESDANDNTERTIGIAVKSETRELRGDINNRIVTDIDGIIHSNTKILDSSLEQSSNLSEQVTSCLDVIVSDDPVSKKLKIRKDIFKHSPSNLHIVASEPMSKPLISKLESTPSANVSYDKHDKCIIGDPEKEKSCRGRCLGTIYNDVGLVNNIEHQGKAEGDNENIEGEYKSLQKGLEKGLSEGEHLTVNHQIILPDNQKTSSKHCQSLACPHTEQAVNETKPEIITTGKGKEIPREIFAIEQTEEVVQLGIKKQTKRKPEDVIQSKTTIKKRKNEDSGEDISLSKMVLGKEVNQDQVNKVNTLFTTNQVPRQHTQSLPSPETGTKQAGNGTKLNMSLYRHLIGREVDQELAYLIKTKRIAISGTKREQMDKKGKIHSELKNLLKFQKYCQEKNKDVSGGAQFTLVHREIGSLSSHSVAPPKVVLALTFGGTEKEPGELCGPLAVAVDEDQLTYVLDSGNRRIKVFNQDYSLLFQFGTGYLDIPNDLAIMRTSNGTDTILVTDKGDKDVKLFTCLSGHFIRTLGLRLTGSPTAVSANSYGTVVVAEARNGITHIIVCDLFGNVSGTFGTPASLCSLYSGLLVTTKGKIYIPNMKSKYTEEFLEYHCYQGMWVGKVGLGFQIQGKVVGISEVGDELLVASLLNSGRLRLTLMMYDTILDKWIAFFKLYSDQNLPFFPCSFTLLSFCPILRVLVGDQQDNLHVLTVPNSHNQII